MRNFQIRAFFEEEYLVLGCRDMRNFQIRAFFEEEYLVLGCRD
jgi:hypothetical protein